MQTFLTPTAALNHSYS